MRGSLVLVDNVGILGQEATQSVLVPAMAQVTALSALHAGDWNSWLPRHTALGTGPCKVLVGGQTFPGSALKRPCF